MLEIRLVEGGSLRILAQRDAVQLAVDLQVLDDARIDDSGQVDIRQVLQLSPTYVFLQVSRIHLQDIRHRFRRR
ncbi:hypothetical protein D3C81_811800 [compost metagenome]